MLVHEFLNILEKLAPAALAEEWDNIGLQTGARASEISKVLVALNVSDEVITEASSQGCGLILTHHPLVFAPLESINEDSAAGRLVSRTIREGIAVVAAHTNLDAAKGGLADVTAELLGLRNVKALSGAPSGWLKLVAFVPFGDLEQVKAGIFDAGAGVIGDYQHCSWSVSGQGSFLPLEDAEPYIGQVGREEAVEELRLEAVFPASQAEPVIDALIRNHSYEEPAYDIVPLKTRRRDAGAGRVGDLDAETALAEVAGQIAELYGLPEVRYAGDPRRHIRRVALIPGSGAAHLDEASSQGAELFITGDFKYHQALRAMDVDLSLIDIPHEVSEAVALENWLPRLGKELAQHNVEAVFSKAETSPWRRSGRRERVSMTQEEEMEMFHLHVDGGSRGNPGPAGIGALLSNPAGEKVDELANFIGEATNNVAEYQALIAGLEMALDRGILRLAIFSDSELMVRQIEGRYKVKNEGLRPFFQQARQLLSRLEKYEIASVPRESNAHADALVNKALDAALRR